MSKPFGTETADFFTVYDSGEFIALYVHLQKVPFTLGPVSYTHLTLPTNREV